MNGDAADRRSAQPRWRVRLVLACLALFALAAIATVVFVPGKKSTVVRSDTDVPLGVEEALIVRYAGPRLVARPYRRGASVNLRIAHEIQQGDARVYDVRYIVNLPGEFDLTEYLASADGSPIDDLPSFTVRGLTSLTKDIETRIQEIEEVDVHIWCWYYETLAGLGVLWVAWLCGLVFVGRPKRPPKPAPPPPQPSISEQIDRYLQALRRGPLGVEEKANLEILILRQWQQRLGLSEQRLASACREIQQSEAAGPVYDVLTNWLHNPRASDDPDEFLSAWENGSRRLPSNRVDSMRNRAASISEE